MIRIQNEPENETPRPSEPLSPWPAVAFAILGGGLAVYAIRAEQAAVEFLACGSLLFAWLLAKMSQRQAGRAQEATPESDAAEDESVPEPRPETEHPLGRHSTQLLLLLFALLTGAMGIYRILQGGPQ